ncbi:DUF4190 domain-containing protein [Chloroflexota bacterium]
MYCPKCGAENPEGASFCQKCGAGLTQPIPASAPAPQQPIVMQAERTSGMAITSLVLGIVGFIINPLSVLAIIFGAVALSQIGKDPTLKGKGMAVAGLVLGIVIAAIWIILIIFASNSFFWFY